MPDEKKQSPWVNAIAIVGSVVAGLLSFAGALFALFNQDSSGFGVCVVATSLAFGLLANAALRE